MVSKTIFQGNPAEVSEELIKKDGLLDYEMTLSSKYKDMNYMEGFCMYNGHDFDKRFNEEERQRLLVHHVKTLKLLQP